MSSLERHLNMALVRKLGLTRQELHERSWVPEPSEPPTLSDTGIKATVLYMIMFVVSERRVSGPLLFVFSFFLFCLQKAAGHLFRLWFFAFLLWPWVVCRALNSTSESCSIQ